jgi:hypothetical protein
MSGEMQAWALWCARRGFRVFRLKPGDRTPAFKGWQGEATSDEAQIQRLWNGTDYNVGVATGNGLAVVDVDVKNGKLGEDTFRGLGFPDDTFVVRTPSGGRHVYYRVSDDVRNSVQALGPGVDVRGVGGYVVGPGSLVDGRQYDVAQKSAIRRFDIPVSQNRVATSRSGGLAGPAVLMDTVAAVDRAIAYLLGDAPLAVEGSGGDATTYKVACELKDIGLSEFTAWDLIAEHWNPRCSPPWDLEDLEKKVRNAFAYGFEPPGTRSPEAAFGDIEVDPPKRAGRAWFYHGDTAVLDETWLFHNLLPARGVAVFVGQTGAGKTFLLTEMARCVATAKPFFGTTVEDKGSSLFLFAGTEGSGFAHRLAALQEKDRLPIAYTQVIGLRENGALDRILEDLKAQQAAMLAQYGVPLRVVFLETLSASGLLSNENDNAEAAMAISNLAQIGRTLGVLVVTSHHPPKHGVGARGAEAIPSNSDYVLEISRKGKEKVRTIELTKARNAEERQVGSYTLVPVEIGKDSKDRPVVSMAVSMGERAPSVERKSAHSELLVECVEHSLLDADAWIEEVKGAPAVCVDDVRALFKMRSGIKDRGNLSRSFGNAMEACEQSGSLEVFPVSGRKFIRRIQL